MHRFWIESLGTWQTARSLWPAMTLRALDGGIACIDHVDSADVCSTTFNLEVAGTHAYFVGERGVLVHNRGGESIFADTGAHVNRIYRVVETTVVNGAKVKRVIYVGKTDQTLKARFNQHLDKKESWREMADRLEIEEWELDNIRNSSMGKALY